MTNPTAKEVVDLRAHSSLTQTEFGALIGAAKRTVQDWESGARNCPSAKFELLQIKVTAGVSGL